MAIPINTECLKCCLNRYLGKAEKLGDEAQAMAFARDLMQVYIDAPRGVSSPYIGLRATELLKKHFGLPDDLYVQEKKDSNAFVLERLPRFRELIRQAPDPLLAGLRFAIMGNYLDFAALQDQVSFGELDRLLEQALQMPLDAEAFRELRQDLKNGKKLLYLTDNAGEIGFDRLFAEEIARQFPQLSITFCVRGGPAHNDALRADAEQVGIPFPVIDNGNRVGGTELSLLSPEARAAMDSADVILSKGMGNTETLYGSPYNIYYAFLIKCRHFQEFFGGEMMQPMLVHQKA